MKVTASKLIRWSGLAAILAGVIFAGIQPIHPADVLASVNTSTWAVVITLKFVMTLLFMVGITGIYARQVEQSGWLGLVGFVMLILTWWLQVGYVFTDLYILPVMATAAPEFVNSFLGIVNQSPGTMDIGGLPAVYSVLGLLYMLGGLLFGIATYRAGVLPRWAGALLAIAAALTPAAALLPHAIQRYAAIPVALAIAWMGYALLTERREGGAQVIPERVSTQMRHSGAK